LNADLRTVFRCTRVIRLSATAAPRGLPYSAPRAAHPVVKSRTDLADWTSVFTNTTPTNVVFYSEPDISSDTARFYRAFQFP
jgi:hypothetical protein